MREPCQTNNGYDVLGRCTSETSGNRTSRRHGQSTLIQHSHRQKSPTKFLSLLVEDLLYFSQQVRLYVKRTSSTYVLSTRRERFTFSVLAMLTGFVIFLTSFISVILSGLNLILVLLSMAAVRLGHSARRVWQSIRT